MMSRKRSLSSSEVPGTVPFRTDRRTCPHCKELVSIKTYKTHRRLFYNEVTDEWSSSSKHTADQSDSDSDTPTSQNDSPPCSQIGNTETDIDDTAMQLSPPDCDTTINESCSEDFSENDSLSEPEEEQWNENEEVVSDLKEATESESEPEDEVTSDSEFQQSPLLARWLALFLLYLQAVHSLSDNVISCVFKFLKSFLTIIGKSSSYCAEIANRLPSSLFKAKKRYSTMLKFKRYIACRRCHTIYFVKDLSTISSTQKECAFRRFPSHPHQRMRSVCGCALIKTVELAGGKKILYPYMIYCYLNIELSIQALFKNPDFVSRCEEWRTNQATEGTYTDVYDGKIWKEFQFFEGKPFLSQQNNLGLIMNFDYFQPYKHLTYSVGAVYLTIMNLPRKIRYKQENVILVGIIPGPKEPDRINPFFKPLVDELLCFWEGIHLSTPSGRSCVRCALLCVACDIPAARKLCGFLSYTAHYACSKCFKWFPGTFGKIDYSGFDRENWPPRTGSTHRQTAMKLQNFVTKSQQSSSESSAGCRYSCLLELPYFDAPRMTIVDPMHNLFLGNAKHHLKSIWIERGILTEDMFASIQQLVDVARVPTGIGRIPSKIRSGFSSFTADQWKNWVNYFSLLTLHGKLGAEDLECWRHLVLACRILTQQRLTSDQISLADALILRFCRRTEQLYGKESITPNMHMSCHLRTCIEDYGPCHGFWLFAFERYNGILGSLPNNNRSIEVQMMKRFVSDNALRSTQLPSEYSKELKPHFLRSERQMVGSLADTIHSQSTAHVHSDWTLNSDVMLPSNRTRCNLTDRQVQQLRNLLSHLYSIPADSLVVGRDYYKYRSVQLYGKTLGTHASRSQASSTVMATWNSDILGFPSVCGTELEGTNPSELLRAARVNTIIVHTIYINNNVLTHAFVSLLWYDCHRKMYSLGKPLTVWCNSFDLESIVPVQFIVSRTVSVSSVIDDECVLVVCPCVEF